MKLFYLFIIISSLFINSFSQSREEYIRLGKMCAKNNDFKRAILIYDEGIGKYNNDEELYVLRGELKSKLSMSISLYKTHVPTSNQILFEDAINDLNKAIEINSNYCYAYKYRGYLYLNHQMYDKAIDDYNKFLNCSDTDKDRFDAFLGRSVCKFRKEEMDNAYDDLKKAQELNPQDFSTYSNIASIYIKQKQYDKAEENIKIAFQLDSTNINVLNNLGFLYIETERYNEALIIFNKLIQKEPNDPYTLNNLGFVLFKLDKISLGLDNVDKSIKIYPDNPYAYKNRGLIHLALKNKNQACEDFKKAIEFGYLKTFGNDLVLLIKRNCN